MTKKTLVLVALLPLMVAGWTMTHRSLVLVDVHEAGGHRIVLPVPLALAQGALHFAPEEAKFVEVPEGGEYLPHLARAIDELEEAPDGPFVDVRDGGDHVVIFKEDGALHVRVSEGGKTKVQLQLSFASAEAALRAYDGETGRLETSGLLAALTSMPRGEVVHVRDGRDEVSIRMW